MWDGGGQMTKMVSDNIDGCHNTRSPNWGILRSSIFDVCKRGVLPQRPPMDNSSVSYDDLYQYMVNFNPMEYGYDCQVTIWPSKFKRKGYIPVCDITYHTNKRK